MNQDVPLDGLLLHVPPLPIWLPNCASAQGPMNGLPPVELVCVPYPPMLAWFRTPASSSTACSESAIRFAAPTGWLADGRRCSGPNLPLHLPVGLSLLMFAVEAGIPQTSVLLAQVVVQALAVALAVQDFARGPEPMPMFKSFANLPLQPLARAAVSTCGDGLLSMRLYPCAASCWSSSRHHVPICWR